MAEYTVNLKPKINSDLYELGFDACARTDFTQYLSRYGIFNADIYSEIGRVAKLGDKSAESRLKSFVKENKDIVPDLERLMNETIEVARSLSKK